MLRLRQGFHGSSQFWQVVSWVCLSLAPPIVARAMKPEVQLTVDVNAAGVPVPRTLHGDFFEDVNHGADGGLYAELVQNRSFEHPQWRNAWCESGPPTTKGTSKLPTNRH
jgi:hypothetical protein